MANLPVSGEWTSAPEFPIAPTPRQVIAPPTKLNVVLPFIESDIPRVIDLLKWCAELSGKVPYSIFLLPFKDINFTEVRMYAERAFADVQVIQDAEGVASDWKKDSLIRDAAGPNSMFRQAAWFFYFHKALGSWLYLEPDCVPLKKDWLPQLEAEYKANLLPFSGVKMQVDNREYLNGVAIYPPHLIQLAPEIVTRTMWQQHPEMEIAFDITGGANVLQKAQLTDKIQLAYRAKWYHDMEIKPEAVLFHGDYDGHLIKALRAKKGQQGGDTNGTTQSNATQSRETIDAGGAEAAASTELTVDGQGASNGAATSEPETAPKFVEIPSESAARYVLKDGNYVPVDPASESKEINPEWLTPHFGSISEEIRYHCDQLLNLVSEAPSRGKIVLEEMRKRKLVPHARKRK